MIFLVERSPDMHRTRLKAWPLSSRDPWSNTTGTRPIHCNYTSDITDELAEVPSTEQKHLSFFWIYLLIMLLQLSHFHPFTQLHPAHPVPPTFPTYSSCPWVILMSSLASTFPTLFLPSPCLFSTYHLCYLFSLPSPPPPPTPLLTTLHVISISMVLFLF